MNLLKQWILLLVVLHIFTFGHNYAQDQESPYNAKAYFEATQNPTYMQLLEKSIEQDSLTEEETKYLNDYKSFLGSYFDNLSETEKSRYNEFKVQWEDELEANRNQEDSDVLEVKRLGIKPGRKFVLSNGIYGFAYGLGGAYVLNIQDSWNIALPFISAGISMAIPLLNPKKYEGIDFSTVMLTRHGKFIGLLDGAALGFLLFGDPDQDEWRGRAIVASTIAGSIALGEVGFQIGKKRKFPEGKVATYKYYSILVPYLAFSGLVAGNVDNPRIYGATVLAAGAAGYFVADRVYKKYQFSRGDMLAASSFGLLSATLGFGLTPVDEPWHILIPAATALGGTVASHSILKNAKFSAKQGWNINYATIVGVVIGLGVSLAIQPDSHNLVFILPAATGMAGWAIFTSKYKKQQFTSSSLEKKRWTDLSFNFTPQNYFINKQIKPITDNPRRSGLPLFSLKLRL